ncbi:hypothetical protein APHAL10511_002506 [Amanita phalloides]|nr:hypothetical protein APHAL10511_002506 [Amanita phalloides]
MYANIISLIILGTCSLVVAQQPFIVCQPGQCLEGYSNVTVGATLSGSGTPVQIHILPGQYASNTNPQLLHNALSSSTNSLSPSVGFNVSAATLPLNLLLQPGIATFTGSFYSGRTAFASLPSSPVGNNSVPLNAGSLVLAPSVWVALEAGSKRLILWDSVPDLSQLPISATTSLSLSDLESSACSPPCSGSGVCSATGTCQCPQGFSGSACESCASEFFGHNCQPCPSGCASCSDGINGSGQCLQPAINNSLSSCNCLNGICGSNGQCSCNPGFTTASNGTACAKCSPGFYLTSAGDCHVCKLGCAQCADGSGTCLQCQQGFSQDSTDTTKCNPPQQTTSTGTVCPNASFSNGNSCQPCDASCQSCKGGTSNDCTLCTSQLYTLNGACVSANSDGICTGTNLIADNNKRMCDSCPAKCTSCKIPNFSVASTVSQLQCTGCLPGFFLSQGQCVPQCPNGTFVSSQDNLTCTACDSSCSTCTGSSTFCLSCANNQLASNGKCVQSCPENTFGSSGSCLTCHPDCATCSVGAVFLRVANRNSLIQLHLRACPVIQVVQAVQEQDQATALPVLIPGVCLSDLVIVPQGSQTNSLPPLPSVTGINNPTSVVVRRPLTWWEILLMTLGCAFIFVVFLWLCRRRAKKRRAKQTAKFAASKGLDQKGNRRWRLARFRERLFGHSKNQHRHSQCESLKLANLKDAEEARNSSDGLLRGDDDDSMLKFIDQYRQTPSPRRSRHGHSLHRTPDADDDVRPLSVVSSHGAPSIYCEATRTRRRGPEPRQPVKELTSRFSMSTFSSQGLQPNAPEKKSTNPFVK